MNQQALEAPPERGGLLRLVWGIFRHPVATLSYVRDHPQRLWLVPAIILGALIVINASVAFPISTRLAQEAMQEQLAQMPPEAQVQVLLVAAFGIANTMTMAIYERTREIGIMKAVGGTNRDVMRIFLGEAGAIGFVGGVVGVLVGVGLGQVINLVVRAYLAQQSGEAPSALVHTPAWLVVFAIFFATIVGVLSGIYPALRAAGLKPVEALRYE